MIGTYSCPGVCLIIILLIVVDKLWFELQTDLQKQSPDIAVLYGPFRAFWTGAQYQPKATSPDSHKEDPTWCVYAGFFWRQSAQHLQSRRRGRWTLAVLISPIKPTERQKVYWRDTCHLTMVGVDRTPGTGEHTAAWRQTVPVTNARLNYWWNRKKACPCYPSIYWSTGITNDPWYAEK